MTLNPKIKFVFILILVLFLNQGSLLAQDYEEEYDDDDYGYTTNSYNNEQYQKYTEQEYKRRNDRFYKKSYKEEDLYNGRYRSKENNDYNGANGLGGGGWNLWSTNKKDNSVSTPNSPYEAPKPKWNPKDGIENGVGQNPNGKDHETFSGSDVFTPGKGRANPNDSDPDSKVPPPPDEPDVPVDTAIPLLISGAILLVSYRFISIKKASV